MLLDLARCGRAFPNMSEDERRQAALGFQPNAQRAITELVASVPFTSQNFPGGSGEPRGFAGMVPGEILVPLPHCSSQETPWATEVEECLQRHRAKGRLVGDSLHPPLAVEIAVPDGGPSVDLDNLAAALLDQLQNVFFAPSTSAPIRTYRIYRVPARLCSSAFALWTR
jgi:hypothetical protein